MGDILKKVPVSVRISILIIAVLWVGIILSYGVIFQNRPVEIWGIRLDRSPETVSKTKMEAEVIDRPTAPTQPLPNETSKKDPSRQVAQATPPTVRTKQTAQEASEATPADISLTDAPRKKELVEPKKTDTNIRQDPSLTPPRSRALLTTKSAPPDIAKIYRAVRSIQKKVDAGNPNGIADPADVSAFNQYLSVLKNRSEIEEIKNMRIIVPENYTQMRDLKAALSGLLVSLEVNYDGLSEF